MEETHDNQGREAHHSRKPVQVVDALPDTHRGITDARAQRVRNLSLDARPTRHR